MDTNPLFLTQALHCIVNVQELGIGIEFLAQQVIFSFLKRPDQPTINRVPVGCIPKGAAAGA